MHGRYAAARRWTGGSRASLALRAAQPSFAAGTLAGKDVRCFTTGRRFERFTLASSLSAGLRDANGGKSDKNDKIRGLVTRTSQAEMMRAYSTAATGSQPVGEGAGGAVKQISKVLIANRGEIAVRIMTAARSLGMKTVAVFAAPDKDCLHVRTADEAIEIFDPNVKGAIAPYLNIEAVVQAAKQTGAQAIVPGYGFLSENYGLAQRCEEEHLTFVGPPKEALTLFGDKTKSRELAVACNVPVIKGCNDVPSAAFAKEFIIKNELRLPVVLKAKHGGGGRGMRVVRKLEEIEESFSRCASEAKTAFGNGDMLLEEYLEGARHIEVQVFGDSFGGLVHLYERDCSVQQRHQKVIEFAPPRGICEELRERLTSCALSLARVTNYRSAGTVEFLVAGDLGDPNATFAFLELNPRIQVEHCVTEEVCQVDLVKAQLQVACGMTLQEIGLQQEWLSTKNSVIQSRVSFAPGGGSKLDVYALPPNAVSFQQGSPVRFDGLGYQGLKPSMQYDPLLGKLIVSTPFGSGDAFEATRVLAVQALEDFKVEGVNTNHKMLSNILNHHDFVHDKISTTWLEAHLSELTAAPATKKLPSSAPKKKVPAKKLGKVEVATPIEGAIVNVRVSADDRIQAGDVVAVLSSMKLETEIRSDVDGKVLEVLVAEGDQVDSSQVLVVLEGEISEVEESTYSEGDGPEVSAAPKIHRPESRSMLAVWEQAYTSPPTRGGPEVLKSSLRVDDERYKARREHNLQLLQTLQERIDQASKGKGGKYTEQHLKRGKLLALDRVKAVIDPGTEFFELSSLAGYGMYQEYGGEVHKGSMVTGIGIVHGRPCLIVVNDSTVKGGTYYPITVKKHLRAQAVAERNHLPCIYMVDSGGAFLPLQSEVFAADDSFGHIFYNQAQMSAKQIPQIAAVLGSCTAGGAYVPAMSEESIIVKGNGTIFLGGPPLVKAATGEVVSAQELGGAEVHTAKSGVADHFAKDEPEALQHIRNVVNSLGPAREAAAGSSAPEAPKYDPEELLGLIPETNRQAFDVKEVIARIVDGSKFHEFKARYATTIVTGFAKIQGYDIGIIGNNGILFGESALKATHFIQLCNARRIPLLYLQNITGFMVGKAYENGGIARDGAKMVTATASATVPKITIIFGGSYGAGNYAMCGRSYNPDFLFTWPNSQISIMGGAQAAGVLSTVKNNQLEREGKPPLEGAALEEFERPILEKYEKEGSPYFATARLWDDGIIDPRDTRKVLSRCLHLFAQRPRDEGPLGSRQFGVFRM
mmetsp:Transcript_72493/g.136940  ORF Transcript_72493/g.136940 Transcript_72493/m.136940 type:complete len:1263 (-) Transcript_72493:6-3794(-)